MDKARLELCYLMQHANLGKVKIGFTNNVVRRMRELKSKIGANLYLLGVVKGGRAMEHQLHHQFRDHREEGEWFKPHDELFDFVADHCNREDATGLLALQTAEVVAAMAERMTADREVAKGVVMKNVWTPPPLPEEPEFAGEAYDPSILNALQGKVDQLKGRTRDPLENSALTPVGLQAPDQGPEQTEHASSGDQPEPVENLLRDTQFAGSAEGRGEAH